MSRATRSSKVIVAPQPDLTADVPPEVIREVFMFVVLSSEDARSRAVKTLCLVNTRWNCIANDTPFLWTEVTLVYPFHPHKLSGAEKWLRASKQLPIDVEIDFHDPTQRYVWGGGHPLRYPKNLRGIITVLQGSECRWRSLTVKSEVWSPIVNFLQARVIPSLPLLESISLQHGGRTFEAGRGRSFYRQSIEFPILFGGKGALMPRLREASLNAVHVDWTTAATSFRNLRRLEMKNQCQQTGPNVEQLASLLAASPTLEVLDFTRYCPSPVSTWLTSTPLVYLPALKCLTLGWSMHDYMCQFLRMFQIPETLETLTLVDTDSKLTASHGENAHTSDSSRIFETLAELAMENSKDPSRPWISMLGLRSLTILWTKSSRDAVIAFMERTAVIEEVYLDCPSKGVLEGVTDFMEATYPGSSTRRFAPGTAGVNQKKFAYSLSLGVARSRG